MIQSGAHATGIATKKNTYKPWKTICFDRQEGQIKKKHILFFYVMSLHGVIIVINVSASHMIPRITHDAVDPFSEEAPVSSYPLDWHRLALQGAYQKLWVC